MPLPARISAVDAHVAGGVVRLVTSGLAAPRGRSLREKAEWMQKHQDELCRSLVLEPRGHAGVTLAVLCEPADPTADAGVLFRRASGFVPVSGQGLLGVAALASTEGLVHSRVRGQLRLETELASFDVLIDAPPGGASTARWTSQPAFVLAGGMPVALGRRSITVDVAWGGAFFVIVDSESAGLPLVRARWPDFARLARPIAAAVESTIAVTHPADVARRGVSGVIFVGASDPGSDGVRCLVAWADGTVDRSASGTGSAALLAVFDAMGLGSREDVRIEGLAGVPLSARITRHTMVDALPAVLVEVSSEAWTTARHEFVVDAADPLRLGVEW